MCGIAGIYAKGESAQQELGAYLADMMAQLVDRGPDSAGVALYREEPGASGVKLSILSAAGPYPWITLLRSLSQIGETAPATVTELPDQIVVRVDAEPAIARAWLAEHHPELIVLSSGQAIETYKQAGDVSRPGGLVEACGLRAMQGGHALGHTRMATESRVTTEHSHPFSTGDDLCLVHNGSLSNHNRLRRSLQRQGINFATDNDSEVAAGYLSWRLREGDDLDAALHHAADDLDGFFTFAIGTRDGFAVMRDPVGCKPAVMAETDDWVAMASEFRAIAVLPGAADAHVWEPEPGRIYTWSRRAAIA
jgi:glutamate synthase domain-containing protein 1